MLRAKHIAPGYSNGLYFRLEIKQGHLLPVLVLQQEFRRVQGVAQLRGKELVLEALLRLLLLEIVGLLNILPNRLQLVLQGLLFAEVDASEFSGLQFHRTLRFHRFFDNQQLLFLLEAVRELVGELLVVDEHLFVDVELLEVNGDFVPELLLGLWRLFLKVVLNLLRNDSGLAHAVVFHIVLHKHLYLLGVQLVMHIRLDILDHEVLHLVDVESEVLVLLQHFLQQDVALGGDVLLNHNLLVFEGLGNVFYRTGLEGTVPMQHFVEKHAQTPNVNLRGVFVFVNDFGRHVFVGATESVPELVLLSVLSGPSEVAELDVEVFIEQHVFRLDVSMNDERLIMEVLNRVNQLKEYLQGYRLS